MSKKMKGRLVGDLNPSRRPEVIEKIKRNRTPCKISEEHKEILKQGRLKYLEQNNGGYWKYHKKDSKSIEKWKETVRIKKLEDPNFMKSHSNLGLIRITDGNINKNIPPEEFNYYQNLGFRRGMTKQTSCWETRRKNHTDQNLSKGRIAVHNLENKTKYIFRAQLEEYISKGYVLGGAKRSK